MGPRHLLHRNLALHHASDQFQDQYGESSCHSSSERPKASAKRQLFDLRGFGDEADAIALASCAFDRGQLRSHGQVQLLAVAQHLRCTGLPLVVCR